MSLDWRGLRDRFLPVGVWMERPWFGVLLLGSAFLFLLFILFTVFVLFAAVDSIYVRGITVLGSVAGQNPGGLYTPGGLNLARLWLLSTLACVPLMLARVWWHFARCERPRSVHKGMEAARRGDPAAAFQVALHYLGRDPSAARSWLLKAAQAGLPEAMVELGRELKEGRGGPKDLPTARAWLLHAREAGAPEAAELLAQVEAQLGDRFSIQGR